MDEEDRNLFIQRKINFLSGHGDERGDSHKVGAKIKPPAKRNRMEMLDDAKREVHADANIPRHKTCASLAQIVDYNMRRNQRSVIVPDDPERNRNDPQQTTLDARKQENQSGAKSLFTNRNFSQQHLEAPQCRNSADPPTLRTVEEGGLVFCNSSTSDKNFVPKELINRIKTENVLLLAKKANKTEIHDPKKCISCRKKDEEIAYYEFVKRQKTKLESAILDRRVDDVIHTTDTVFMIGEIARTLPRPSENRDLIWKRLLRKES